MKFHSTLGVAHRVSYRAKSEIESVGVSYRAKTEIESARGAHKAKLNRSFKILQHCKTF